MVYLNGPRPPPHVLSGGWHHATSESPGLLFGFDAQTLFVLAEVGQYV